MKRQRGTDTVLGGKFLQLQRPSKQRAIPDLSAAKAHETDNIYHPVLSFYYDRVLRLRHFLLKRLEQYNASKKRLTLVRNTIDEHNLLDGVLVGIVSEGNSRQPSFSDLDTLERICELSGDASQAWSSLNVRLFFSTT